jgi:hypothetical protein
MTKPVNLYETIDSINMPLSVEAFGEPRPFQDISSFEMSGNDILSLLSMHDTYGAWRLDLASGKVEWSKDVYEIHGMPFTEGSVDLASAIAAYHPEDAKIVAQLIEEAIANKSGYRFVLRLRRPNGTCKMVKSIAKYRKRENGKEELIGLFSQFALPIRSIAATTA